MNIQVDAISRNVPSYWSDNVKTVAKEVLAVAGVTSYFALSIIGGALIDKALGGGGTRGAYAGASVAGLAGRFVRSSTIWNPITSSKVVIDNILVSGVVGSFAAFSSLLTKDDENPLIVGDTLRYLAFSYPIALGCYLLENLERATASI